MSKKKDIDTRILKTRYRNYDLLARFWNGEYRGRAWLRKKKIADYDGDNLDLILENLMSIVDQDRERREAHLNSKRKIIK